jgi:hypothetical protein
MLHVSGIGSLFGLLQDAKLAHPPQGCAGRPAVAGATEAGQLGQSVKSAVDLVR